MLVTNLENHVQPLIRYELTDVVTGHPAGAADGHLRGTVHGRCDEVFHYDAVSMHPHVVRSVLVQSPEVAEYQVRQTPSGLDLTVVAEPGTADPDEQALAARLAAALAGAGLPTPHVTVEVTPRLDRDPRTGKLRRFVPLPGTPART